MSLMCMALQNPYVEALNLGGTVFEDRACAEVIKIK